MEITVAVFESRIGSTFRWTTLGLGDLNRSREGKHAAKLRQRMIRDLRKALRDTPPSRLAALELSIGLQLKRPRLELNLRGSAGGRRRRSGRFPLVIAPRTASSGHRLQVAYHPLRQKAWFPLNDGGGLTLEEQTALFFGQEWADVGDDELKSLEAGRDRLRFLAFNARPRTLLDSLHQDDDDGPALIGAGTSHFSLHDIGVNESERAADGRLPLGSPRSPYRERLGRLLAGRRATPVLLVGAPGVGKTTLIHRLVDDLMATDGYPAHGNLDRCRAVWRISGRRLIAGMSHFGEWEQRAIRLIEEVSLKNTRRDASSSRRRDAAKPAVLWVEDLHAFGRIGRTVESNRALADVFRAPLARREIAMIAECTPAQLQVLEDDAPALATAFSVIHVAEPSRAETLSMMIAEVRRIELDHNVVIEPSALRCLLDVSDTLFRASALPGKALELLRALVWHGAEELSELSNQAKVSDRKHTGRRHLGGAAVLALAAQRTGIPRRLLEPSSRLTAAGVEADLERAVLGQPQAIAVAREAILRLKTGLTDPRRPYAVMLLTGPTGTGKTEMAKAIAAYLYQSKRGGSSRLLRFDMSEYSDPDAAARLTGDRARPRGLLTAAVSEQPFCVVLFDEIEKCHPRVLHLLLQVMGDGRLTDAAGNVADFTHSVVIMTSNLGAGGAARVGFGDGGDALAQEIHRAVRAHFPPELFNRIDRVVPFVPLSTEVARAIARKELAQLLSRRGLLDRDIFVSVTDSALERVVREGFDVDQGARSLKRYLDRHIGGLLAEQIAGSTQAMMRNIRVFARESDFALQVETLREAQAMAASSLEPLLKLSAEALRARLPAALTFIDDLIQGPELARLATELRQHLRAFRAGGRDKPHSRPSSSDGQRLDAATAAEKIYDLDAMRGRMQHFRDRLARQLEASDPDESELIELERFGVLTLRGPDRWGDRVRARWLDSRFFATAPKQAGKAELLALLAETHFIRRALDRVRDGRRHAVTVELRRVGRRAVSQSLRTPDEGLLEWLAGAYADDFGALEGFAARVQSGGGANPGGRRIVEGASVLELKTVLEKRVDHLVLKLVGLSVLDLFKGEAGCHLSRGLMTPTEIVSVSVRSATAEDGPVALLEQHAVRRRRFIEALEAGAEDPGENPDTLGPIVRRYRFDPPATGRADCEVEDYVLCYAGHHRVRSFDEVIAILGLLHRSAEAEASAAQGHQPNPSGEES